MTPSTSGPVSAALEADLRAEVRRQGIVIWLDRDGHYSPFVDRLIERRSQHDLPFAVAGYRGSFLKLLFELERTAGGLDKPQLLIHMPGFYEDSIKNTPLLELYEAGVRYRKALDTLVADASAGRLHPDRIAAIQSRAGLTLELADALVSAELDAFEGGLATQLRTLSLPSLMDELLARGELAASLAGPGPSATLWQVLSARTGIQETWRDALLPEGSARASDVAFVVAAWALCVEYVHDLRRAPYDPRLVAIRGMPGGVVEACCGLASHLRARHEDFYRATADETEGWLADEVAQAVAEDLGKIDTFRFEEDKLLKAGLAALAQDRWDEALTWTSPRLHGESFWLKADASRRAAWQLLEDAARLGQAIVQAGPGLAAVSSKKGVSVDTHDAALERYVSVGAAVDRAHRQLEQHRTGLLFPQLPAFEQLRTRLDALREAWCRWADGWTKDYSILCKKVGFLPDIDLQQRTLFDQVVKPLTRDNETTAYFVVDAFRFEMAEELRMGIQGTPATNVQLKGRFAELPTLTDIGMNVLAPLSVHGRLRPIVLGGALKGFQSGEFQVRSPDTRQRAMFERIGGATCPWLTLSEVVSRDATSLRRAVAQAKLVVVHSTEIDDAGENGVGTAVFDGVLQKLRAAWRLLHEAGVKRFVFTADHGFLLHSQDAAPVQSHGRKVDPRRRHVLTPVAANHTGEVRVALSELGYDGVPDLHLMFPDTTAVFDTGDRPRSFVHGGNSLQERIIPVLTVLHRAGAGGNDRSYKVTARALEGVAGLHCLEGEVEPVAQEGLQFGGRRDVELALRVAEVDGITVELCQARQGARLEGGSLRTSVGTRFEVFFRLVGPVETRARVEVYHPGSAVQVAPALVEGRFEVTASRTTARPESATARAGSAASDGPAHSGESSPHQGAKEPQRESAGSGTRAWLNDLPEGGVRQLFEHLAAYGSVTEAEAADMLGGPSKLRRFSLRFEEYVLQTPFTVRIDVVGGVKRYVREGRA